MILSPASLISRRFVECSVIFPPPPSTTIAEQLSGNGCSELYRFSSMLMSRLEPTRVEKSRRRIPAAKKHHVAYFFLAKKATVPTIHITVTNPKGYNGSAINLIRKAIRSNKIKWRFLL
jgi:hypothetical protein